jgi:hypothetical protein
MRYGESRNPEGRPSKWNLGRTKTIRVPEAIADDILQIARKLDNNDLQDTSQNLDSTDISQAIALLEQALTFPANTGGRIKRNIRAALEHLQQP